jgi:hypothetical protein
MLQPRAPHNGLSVFCEDYMASMREVEICIAKISFMQKIG